MGSVVLTTANGNTVQSRQYYPYGNKRGGNDFSFEPNYTGQRLDDSGLLYYNARYYDPKLGQFLSPDTVNPDRTDYFSYKPYLYARGNPISNNDPSGHIPNPFDPVKYLYEAIEGGGGGGWASEVEPEFVPVEGPVEGEVYAGEAEIGPADATLEAQGEGPQFVRNQPIPQADIEGGRPSAAYQIFTTGKDYEEVWELSSGRAVHLDAVNDGYVVESKWIGGDNAEWDKSPYNPTTGLRDEKVTIDQASRQIQFAHEAYLKGVRWEVSNEAGRTYFENLFKANFPDEMKSGFLQVWSVPGNGMWSTFPTLDAK